MSIFSTQVKNEIYVAITIPANGATGTSIAALLSAAGYNGAISAVIIDGVLAGTAGNAGAARPAFLAATPRAGNIAIASADYTTHGRYIPAGQLYYTPAETDAQTVYLMSTNGSTIVALAVVLN